jgi:hypothetical protein
MLSISRGANWMAKEMERWMECASLSHLDCNWIDFSFECLVRTFLDW